VAWSRCRRRRQRNTQNAFRISRPHTQSNTGALDGHASTDDRSPHAFWDNTLPPRVGIKLGDTVVFETMEASAGQITPS
jgi:hypothetical protein